MKNETNEFSFVLKPSHIPGAGIGIFATHNIAVGTKLILNVEGSESRILDEEHVPEELFNDYNAFEEPNELKANYYSK